MAIEAQPCPEVTAGSVLLLRGREGLSPPPLFFEIENRGSITGLKSLDKARHAKIAEHDGQSHYSVMNHPDSSLADATFGGKEKGRGKWRAHSHAQILMSWHGQPCAVNNHDFKSWRPVCEERDERQQRVESRFRAAEQEAARRADEASERRREQREAQRQRQLALEEAASARRGSDSLEGGPSLNEADDSTLTPTGLARRKSDEAGVEDGKGSSEDNAEEDEMSPNAHLKAVLPDAALVLERLRAGDKGFSPQEQERVNSTFNRFRNPDSQEVHKDELADVLRHLGYSQINLEKIGEIANSFTEYTVLEKEDFMQFVMEFAAYEREIFKEIFDRFDDDGSGELDEEELRDAMIALGFNPLRKMVNGR